MANRLGKLIIIMIIENLLQELCESTSNCPSGLMSQLKEIRRDIRHANKTINLERLSTSMNDKLYELEDAYKDHFIGFENSHGSYAQSFDVMASKFDLDKQNLTGVNIGYSVDTLESLAKSVEDDFKQQSIATYNLDMAHIHFRTKQDAVLARHILLIGQMDDIESTLNYIDREQSVNRTILQDAVEKQLIKQSESEIEDQISEGALLKTMYNDTLKKFSRIDEILFECRNYRHLPAVKLIESRFFRSRIEYPLSFSDSLYQITQAALNTSQKSRATMTELSKMSKSLNKSLESSEHSMINQLGKDLKIFKKDLDDLSSRLKHLDDEVHELQYALNPITLIKNSTQELSKSNFDIRQWMTDRLVPTEQELSSVHVYYIDQTHGLIEWTNLLSLPESIDQIEANLHQANLNIDQMLSDENKTECD